MKTLLDVLVENHEMYCLSFRCVLVNKSFIFSDVSTDHWITFRLRDRLTVGRDSIGSVSAIYR